MTDNQIADTFNDFITDRVGNAEVDEPPYDDAVKELREWVDCNVEWDSDGCDGRVDYDASPMKLVQYIDMVERDYVRRDEHERIVQEMVEANTRQCERTNELTTERDELQAKLEKEEQLNSEGWNQAFENANVADENARRYNALLDKCKQLEAERDKWKAKTEGRESLAGRASADYLRKLDECDELERERDEWKAKAEGFTEALEKLGCSVMANGTVFGPTEVKSAKRAAAVERLRKMKYVDDYGDWVEAIAEVVKSEHKSKIGDCGMWESLIDLLTDDDANDDSAPENVVSAADVDANDGNAAQDSREKLDDRWYAHGGVMQLTRENVEKLRGIVKKQVKLMGEECEFAITDELHDSREKLEADIEEYLACEYGCIPGIVAVYPDWLDRQAAITGRELAESARSDCDICGNDYRRQRDELQAKVDELERDNERLLSKVRELRDLLEDAEYKLAALEGATVVNDDGEVVS